MSSYLSLNKTHAVSVTANPAGTLLLPLSPAAPRLPLLKSKESYRSNPGPLDNIEFS